MESKFIIVCEETNFSVTDTEMIIKESRAETLSFVTNTNKNVRRVFSVNEFGEVNHYKLVLEGFKFNLKEVKK